MNQDFSLTDKQREDVHSVDSLLKDLLGIEELPKDQIELYKMLNEALEIAAERFDRKAIEILFKAGAEPDANCGKILYKIMKAEKDTPFISGFVELFFVAQTKWGFEDPELYLLSMALYGATCCHDISMIPELLERGADPIRHSASLNIAIDEKESEIVDLFLEHIQDKSLEDAGVLDAIGRTGDLELLKRLLAGWEFSSEDFKEGFDTALSCGKGDVYDFLDKHAPRSISRVQFLVPSIKGNLIDQTKTILQNEKLLELDIRHAGHQAYMSGHLEMLRALLLDDRFPPNRYIGDCMSYQAREFNFSLLATKILGCEKESDPIRALNDLCAGNSKPLKSDAFQKEKSWRKQHFVRCALWTAAMTAVLSPSRINNPARADSVFTRFRKIIKNDIERVEQTVGLSWKKYEELLDRNMIGITNFDDILTEIGESCYLPLFCRKAVSIGFNFETDPEMFLKTVRQTIKQEIGLYVIDNKSTLDFSIFNRKWHIPGNHLPDALRPYKLLGDWIPLFEGVVELSDSYSIVSRTSPEALKREGELLDNCVGTGSYASSCQLGEIHILSLLFSGKRCATIELRSTNDVKEREDFQTDDGKRWILNQFYRTGNSSALPRDRAALNEFFRKIQREEIGLAEKSGLKEKKASSGDILLPHERVIGYALSDMEEVLPQLLDFYERRIFVPRKNEDDIPLTTRENFHAAWIENGGENVDFLS